MSDDRYRGVPLAAIADIKLTSEFGSITHLAGRRMNEIQVYIPAGMLPSKVLGRFQKLLKQSGFEAPPGYDLQYGGEAAKRDEAISNLMASVGILLVLMVATLVLSFGSFRMASIVGFVGAASVGLGMGDAVGVWFSVRVHGDHWHHGIDGRRDQRHDRCVSGDSWRCCRRRR